MYVRARPSSHCDLPSGLAGVAVYRAFFGPPDHGLTLVARAPFPYLIEDRATRLRQRVGAPTTLLQALMRRWALGLVKPLRLFNARVALCPERGVGVGLIAKN